LEHLSLELLTSCFAAITKFLRPNGASVHCFDFIVQGSGEAHDLENAQRILAAQAAIAHNTTPDLALLIARLRDDVETFYLSPQGHHQWRGGRAYSEFPFRKVVSLQTITLKPAAA
jgi:hypothetical protein